MKKVLVFILFNLSYTTVYSQTVGGIRISEFEAEFIQIVGTSSLLGSKVTIEVDHGQEIKSFKERDVQIKDDEGKPIKFNSMVHALNFMSQNGYEFVNAFAITSGGSNVYHYLMRKRK